MHILNLKKFTLVMRFFKFKFIFPWVINRNLRVNQLLMNFCKVSLSLYNCKIVDKANFYLDLFNGFYAFQNDDITVMKINFLV